MAATLASIVSHLDQLLDVHSFQDSSLNGLQVDSGRAEIRSIAFAVDSGLSVIEEAAKLSSDLLVVHHGLFWGSTAPITGVLGQKIRSLISHGCSLYAAHLPLDSHIDHGNAALLAKFLGAKEIEPFFHYQNKTIGIKAKFSSPRQLDDIAEQLKSLEGAPSKIHVFPSGKKEISSLGIVTGSGSSLIASCAAANLDLFISGEPKHEVFHGLKELGLSAIFAGHYATETFGVRDLQRILQERFRVDAHFINQPSDV